MLSQMSAAFFGSHVNFIFRFHVLILRVPSSRLLVEFAPRLFQAQL